MNYYYQLLGVEPNADWDTIKRAYRKKALECHPDVCKDPDAKEKFVRILHAYQVLSKQQKTSRPFVDTKGPQTTTRTTNQDFMKEWRKRNPYPEDLKDDWSSLWNDIVDGAKRATKEWKQSSTSTTTTTQRVEPTGSFLDDLVSFIQDQLVGLSSKEQEEDFERVLRSGNSQLLRKEMEHRMALLETLQKRLETCEALVKAKKRILDCLQEIDDSYNGQSHIQDELAKEIEIAQWEKEKWDGKVFKIKQQIQLEMDKVSRLKTQMEVDDELRDLKQQMGL